MKYNPLKPLFDQHVIPYSALCEYYAIGDVHGCVDEYNTLVAQVHADARALGKTARIIQLGDMIDRGPSFFELIMHDKADYKVMGNHEYNFIIEHYGYKPCNSRARMVNHDTLSALPKDVAKQVVNLLINRETYYVLHMPTVGDATHTFVLSHAPIKEIEKGIYSITKGGVGSIPDYCMRSSAIDMEALRNRHFIPVTFVHGHQSWNYVDIEEQVKEQLDHSVTAYNIDSNCVYGKHLIALRLRDNHVLKVASNICVDK